MQFDNNINVAVASKNENDEPMILIADSVLRHQNGKKEKLFDTTTEWCKAEYLESEV